MSSTLSLAQTILLRSQKSVMLPSRLRFESTDAVDEDKCIYPKRFSQSRDVYYTTNTRGQVVEISNPSQQFKSQLRKSPKCDPASSPVTLSETKHHPTKPYTSISSDPRKLFNCLMDMISSKTDRQLLASSAAVLLKRHTARCKDPNQVSSGYRKIPQTRKYTSLREAAPLSSCHMYDDSEWPRVRAIMMDVIKSFSLECLLEDTEEGYRRAFPNHMLRYQWTDTLVSYTVMSLVHVYLFDNPFHESLFYEQMKASSQKTKDVFDIINTQYKSLLKNQLSQRTADDGLRVCLSRAFPKEMDQELKYFHTSDHEIKRYTYDLAVHYNDDGEDYPWYEAAYDELIEDFDQEFEQMRLMKLDLENLREAHLDYTPEFEQKEEEYQENMLQCVSYHTSKDFYHDSSVYN